MKKTNCKISRGGAEPTKLPTSFTTRVLEVVAAIPRGSVLTYAEVASRAGSSLASRAVGNILAKNYDPRVPCNRVIRSDGQLGGYNRGAAQKKKILVAEGAIKT